jgi:hypothetical protein
LDICTPASDDVSGQVLVMDGGIDLQATGSAVVPKCLAPGEKAMAVARVTLARRVADRLVVTGCTAT